jgi:hypothetical protein
MGSEPIAAIAARQHGNITRAQLIAAGSRGGAGRGADGRAQSRRRAFAVARRRVARADRDHHPDPPPSRRPVGAPLERARRSGHHRALPNPAAVNRGLAAKLASGSAAARVRQALSLEPSSTTDKSWPLTVGIWIYALIASAMVIVYILNQNETPGTVKALAVTFGGYVLALLNNAYGLSKGVR